MTYASKDDLFSTDDIAGVVDHTLPSGKVVKLRALTGYEVHLMRKRADNDNTDVADAIALSMGMVEPRLTEEEALRWMRTRPAGETASASARLRDISAMNDDSLGAAYKSTDTDTGD